MIKFQSETIPVEQISKEVENASGVFNALKGLSFDDAIEKIANGIVSLGFKLLIAILVFYVGKFIIKRLYRWTQSLMIRRDVDASLTTFVLSLIKITLYFILIVTVIGIMGIETSSFIALFASAGVAIGMALSGTLQNFAGGVLILLLKPYKVGDFIEAQGYTGSVKAINIFNTVINTPDNKSIIIPNGGLSTSSVNNYSLEGYRRVDWTVGLAYGTDYDKAANTIMSMLLEDPRIVKEYMEDDVKERLIELESNEKADAEKDNQSESLNQPPSNGKKLNWWQRMRNRSKRHHEEVAQQIRDRLRLRAGQPVKTDCKPFVGLNELADSSINLVVRAWTPSRYYWPLFFEMNRRFYVELPQKGFEFPFPQMDVHIDNQN